MSGWGLVWLLAGLGLAFPARPRLLRFWRVTCPNFARSIWRRDEERCSRQAVSDVEGRNQTQTVKDGAWRLERLRLLMDSLEPVGF